MCMMQFLLKWLQQMKLDECMTWSQPHQCHTIQIHNGTLGVAVQHMWAHFFYILYLSSSCQLGNALVASCSSNVISEAGIICIWTYNMQTQATEQPIS